jgi:hypothetical protein
MNRSGRASSHNHLFRPIANANAHESDTNNRRPLRVMQEAALGHNDSMTAINITNINDLNKDTSSSSRNAASALFYNENDEQDEDDEDEIDEQLEQEESSNESNLDDPIEPIGPVLTIGNNKNNSNSSSSNNTTTNNKNNNNDEINNNSNNNNNFNELLRENQRRLKTMSKQVLNEFQNLIARELRAANNTHQSQQEHSDEMQQNDLSNTNFNGVSSATQQNSLALLPPPPPPPTASAAKPREHESNRSASQTHDAFSFTNNEANTNYNYNNNMTKNENGMATTAAESMDDISSDLEEDEDAEIGSIEADSLLEDVRIEPGTGTPEPSARLQSRSNQSIEDAAGEPFDPIDSASAQQHTTIPITRATVMLNTKENNSNNKNKAATLFIVSQGKRLKFYSLNKK